MQKKLTDKVVFIFIKKFLDLLVEEGGHQCQTGHTTSVHLEIKCLSLLPEMCLFKYDLRFIFTSC